MLGDDGDVYCDTCGTKMLPGMFPFCSKRFPGTHEMGAGFRERDEIPGGVELENYGSQPVTFYSHSERRAWMKKNGLNEKECFSPFPGTDKDPQGIPNPAGYVDTVTMRNREILALRAAGCKVEDDSVDGVLGDSFSGTLTESDAAKIAGGDVRKQARLGRRIANAGHTGS